jgi:hypothetical protein
MNRTRPLSTIRRLACTLAGLAAALLAATAAATASFARPIPLAPGRDATQTIIIGGMPGWQIALIAVAAAIVAAAVAVLLDRARAARRHQPAPSA